FNFTVTAVAGTGPFVQIIDDGDAVGWFATPGFSSTPAGPGFQGDRSFAAPGTGSEAAVWTFTGLTAGIYRIAATWVPNPQYATNTLYALLDGPSTVLGVEYVNQEVTPNHFIANGAAWYTLGTYNVTSGNLIAAALNLANGLAVADAIRIERLSASPIQVKDDGDAGYSAPGFTSFTGAGFQNDLSYALPGTGSNQATWTFSGLASGVYRVSVTWLPVFFLATDARYTVLDGASSQGTFVVNQQQ